MACSTCPLAGTRSRYCTVMEPKGADIMIVGDSVPHLSEKTGNVLNNSAMEYLTECLTEIGINIHDCHVTYATKCAGKVSTAAEKHCLSILQDELEIVKPKYVLALGAKALSALVGKSPTWKSSRGRRIRHNGMIILPTVSPGTVMRKPSEKWEWEADLEYFKRIVDSRGVIHFPKDFSWKVITDDYELDGLVEVFKKKNVVAYDIETTSIKDHRNGKLLMIGLSVDDTCYVIPWELSLYSLSQEKIVDVLNTMFSAEEIKKVAHNAKFDNRWLRSRGVRPHVDDDTFLMAYTLNNIIPHGLKFLSKWLCGAWDYDEGIEFKEELSTMEFYDMALYCALDVYYTLKLYGTLKREMSSVGEGDVDSYKVYRSIVMPGERVLQKIESRGTYVNHERLERLKKDYEKQLAEKEVELDKALPPTVDWDVNWNSPDQIAEVLFDHCGLEPIDWTSTGKRATGKSVLLRLAEKHPVPRLLLEVRKLSKALSGFLNPWKDYISTELEEGRQPRLYTTYNIARTATGRLSAEDPNLQQVPRNKEVRSLITAPEGRVLIEADFSQIELRVAAFIAGADSMKQIYRERGDIHTSTGSDITGKNPDDVTSEERTLAKAVNFGFLYGMWWKAFKSYAFDSYGVTVTDEEAQHARERYFTKYPELESWHERQRREVRRYKAVRSPIGRVRWLPDVDSFDKDLSSGAERQAINTPVQSFASDLTLIAMILIDRELEKRYGDEAFLVGQVHDAILIESDAKIAVEVSRIVKYIMENVATPVRKSFGVAFDIPIQADVEIGPWGDGVSPDEFAKTLAR